MEEVSSYEMRLSKWKSPMRKFSAMRRNCLNLFVRRLSQRGEKQDPLRKRNSSWVSATFRVWAKNSRRHFLSKDSSLCRSRGWIPLARIEYLPTSQPIKHLHLTTIRPLTYSASSQGFFSTKIWDSVTASVGSVISLQATSAVPSFLFLSQVGPGVLLYAYHLTCLANLCINIWISAMIFVILISELPGWWLLDCSLTFPVAIATLNRWKSQKTQIYSKLECIRPKSCHFKENWRSKMIERSGQLLAPNTGSDDPVLRTI